MDDFKRATLLPWQADPSGWTPACRAPNKVGRAKLRRELRRLLNLSEEPEDAVKQRV